MTANSDWLDYSTDPSEDDPEIHPDILAERKAARRHNVPWTEWHKIDPDAPREWFAESAIEGNPLIVLSGPEKSGKSWAAIQLAVATTHGGYWLDAWRITRPGNVVYLDSEYGGQDFQRRVRRIARADQITEEVLYAIRHLHSGDISLDLECVKLRRIIKDIKEFPPALVVIDPFRNHLPGDETIAKDVLAALAVVAEIRDVAKCPVLLLHHLTKGGTMAGSRAVSTRADLLIDGTDKEVPLYTARGRYLRRQDTITEPFEIRIEHEHDENDALAESYVYRHVETVESTILTHCRAAPRTANWLAKACKRSGDAIGDICEALLLAGDLERIQVTVQGRAFWAFKKA